MGVGRAVSRDLRIALAFGPVFEPRRRAERRRARLLLAAGFWPIVLLGLPPCPARLAPPRVVRLRLARNLAAADRAVLRSGRGADRRSQPARRRVAANVAARLAAGVRNPARQLWPRAVYSGRPARARRHLAGL